MGFVLISLKAIFKSTGARDPVAKLMQGDNRLILYGTCLGWSWLGWGTTLGLASVDMHGNR